MARRPLNNELTMVSRLLSIFESFARISTIMQYHAGFLPRLVRSDAACDDCTTSSFGHSRWKIQNDAASARRHS
eukprot:CAMPEP_0198109190 /NCGR_PEP_ID=MMETSP1442-20131203/1207_1 /TAXON_ID= /ORGANISM="Craspedostauros australis, Strain CCMP3328" /LENGTH=73 /DNA_ID=CAMNT_0043764731 /DNA_START=161 /DNA_END=378 /DNA_ORIENTATION=+